jgi:hypothetical protein
MGAVLRYLFLPTELLWDAVPDLLVLTSSIIGTLVLYYATQYWQVLLVLSSATGVCPCQVDDLLTSTAQEYCSNRIITFLF